jgi:hypothetical protein
VSRPMKELTEVEHHVATLFASLELSRTSWLVTSPSPGSVTMSKHSISAGDGAGLLGLLARMRAKAESSAGVPVEIVFIQEAGLDGFWVHRLLEANGIKSHVVDAASIAVPRRRRRAKTDAIDVCGVGAAADERAQPRRKQDIGRGNPRDAVVPHEGEIVTKRATLTTAARRMAFSSVAWLWQRPQGLAFGDPLARAMALDPAATAKQRASMPLW